MPVFPLTEYTTLEFTCDLIRAIIIISLLALLSKTIFKSQSFFLSAVIGLMFAASLTSIVASFQAYLSKFIIITCLIASIGLGLKRANKNARIYFEKFRTKQTTFSFLSISFFFICLTFFTFSTLQRLQSFNTASVLLNSHEPYIMGIPIEIVDAEYKGRLRIFDMYPALWAKFHFFSGSVIAIPMFAMGETSYATYLIAKSVVISFFASANFELLMTRQKPKLVFFLIVVVSSLIGSQHLSGLLLWHLNTPGYLIAMLLPMTFLALVIKNNRLFLFFVLMLSASSARMLIPASFLLMYFLYKNTGFIKKLTLKGIKEQIQFVSLLMVGILANIVMVFSGKSSTSNLFDNIYSFFYRTFLNPAFMFSSPDWQINISGSSSAISLLSQVETFRQEFSPYEYLFNVEIPGKTQVVSSAIFILAFLYVVLMNSGNISVGNRLRDTLFNFPRKGFSYPLIVIILFVLAFSLGIILRRPQDIFWTVTLTVLPILGSLVLSPKGILGYVGIFAFALLIQSIFLDASMWAPAISSMDFLLWNFLTLHLIVFAQRLNTLRLKAYTLVQISILIFNLAFYRPSVYDTFSVSDRTTKIVNATSPISLGIELYCPSPIDRLAILYSYAGIRVGYSKDRTVEWAASAPFATINSELQRQINNQCRR